MGTGSGAMAGSAVLFLVLCSLPYMHALCCTKKIVSGAAAGDLEGTYTLLNDVEDEKNPACFDGCVYAREGKLGEEYCFQSVAGGADIEDQCDAPTGTTAAAAGAQTTAGAGAQTTAGAGARTTPLSSDELRQKAEDAAARVKANNAIIVEDNERIEKAEATTSAIDAIQAKLTDEATTPTGRIRQKRQATTNAPTPKAVDVPGTCEEFGITYNDLLDMAADVTDDNIAQIKVYVDALINVDVAVLCNSDALKTLASQTSTWAEAAVKSTKDYTGAKETKIEALKKEVNEDIELQSTINDELVEREEATVPIGAQTYAVDATTPSGSGGEQTPVDINTPKETTPVEGETPEGTPPAEVETPEGTPPAESGTPEGTPPAEGETPEGTPPAEGETPEGTPSAESGTLEGTPPAEGETAEGTPPAEAGTPEGTPPADGETPEGTPPPFSTARPNRLLFERKRRSRGSMF